MVKSVAKKRQQEKPQPGPSREKNALQSARTVMRPPRFQSPAAVQLYTRLRTAQLDELDEWCANGAAEEFRRLQLCEAALLTTLLFHKLER